MKNKILVIEDDADINTLLKKILERAGYEAETAFSGTEGRLLLKLNTYDLVLLDLMLPGLSGEELLTEIRKTLRMPVIALTAKAGLSDKVNVLGSGADDYITKPFGTGELLARVRAALRTNRFGVLGGMPGGVFRAQGLEINYERRKVFVDGAEIKLTQTEYNIVAFLSEHAGRVMTYAAIVRAIWGDTDCGSTKKLQVNMANIRKKLGSVPGRNTYILNELGVGYRMIDEDTDARPEN